MANQEHLKILKQGVEAWNEWREKNPKIKPDLYEAVLRGANLHNVNLYVANLEKANLHRANLSMAYLEKANLHRANLTCAHLTWANLYNANLSGADLRKATLHSANLSVAYLTNADLRGADLREATLVRTNLENSNLNNCSIYGISVWDVKIDDKTKQSDLVITPADESAITVDNLEVAQFIYLLLNNEKIRDVIRTIATKAVLILGRFTDERKQVLDAIRDELRRRDYLPILFDFDKPPTKTTLETVSILANMAYFVIADITDAKTILQELQMIVPLNVSLPIQPILLASQQEPGMFDFFRRFPWFLKTCSYETPKALLSTLEEKVIIPAEVKAKELQGSL